MAGLNTAIHRTGSPAMLEGRCPSAGLADTPGNAVFVGSESVGIFKPDARVYELVAKVRLQRHRKCCLYRPNGWDAAAATGFWASTTSLGHVRANAMEPLPWKPVHVAAGT